MSTLDSFRYSLKFEFSGAVAEDKINELRNETMVDEPRMVPRLESNKRLTIEITGSYVAPDREQNSWKIGSNRLTQTLVGKTGTLQFNNEKPISGSSATRALDFDSAAFMWEEQFLPWTVRIAPGSLSCYAASEKVNGVTVRNCGAESATSDQAFDLIDVFGGKAIQHYDKAKFDLYLLEGRNVPVQLKINVEGKDKSGRPASLAFRMDITDINSKSIRIELPR